jgi:hypothetical protein
MRTDGPTTHMAYVRREHKWSKVIDMSSCSYSCCGIEKKRVLVCGVLRGIGADNPVSSDRASSGQAAPHIVLMAYIIYHLHQR